MALVMQSGRPGADMVTEKSQHRLMIALLLLSFVMPFFFFVVGLRLSMYRVYLIVFMFMAISRWLSGVGGAIRAPDILVIAASLWMSLALLINHGVASMWQFAGMLIIETVIPYLLARVIIRDLAAFRAFVWWFTAVVMVLVPFALFENITGKPILLDMFRGVLKVYYNVNQVPRMGLERAQASMPHPILFGVFCSPAFALSWYMLSPEGAFFKQVQRPFIVGVAVFSSLSSGAFMGILLQAFLIAWDEILKSIKKRWKIFAILLGILYIILELASNRNAFQIIATELTFSAGSAWNRIHIFNNAIDDIFRNPIFGIGMGEWTRPKWLKPSVDNFWLLVALRYGIPAFIFLGLAVLITCWQVGRAPLTGVYARARIGYLIAFASLSIAAFTVHLWDATYCLFMFLLGCGMWFVDIDQTSDAGQTGEKNPSGRKTIQYTRFSQKSSEAPDTSEATAVTRLSR